MKNKLQHILLIDDDDLANRLNEMVLEEADCVDRIVSLQSGEAALAYLKRNDPKDQTKPDLIFLDINMPGMNGWEFLEAFNALEAQQKDPMAVVILTTSVNPADKEKASTFSQVLDYRYKPITLEMIEEIMEDHFHFI